MSHIESAAVPLPALRAMQGLFDHGRLETRQRVLIHGAAGGVGSFAVQLSHLRGAYVIATASRERVQTVRTLGADEVIDHTTTDFTAIEPVDLVYDTVGGVPLSRSVSVVKPGGRLISVAGEPPLDLCAERGVEGVYFVVEPNRSQLDELTHLIGEGSMRVLVDRTYPLSDAREAFKRSLQRGRQGKERWFSPSLVKIDPRLPPGSPGGFGAFNSG